MVDLVRPGGVMTGPVGSVARSGIAAAACALSLGASLPGAALELLLQAVAVSSARRAPQNASLASRRWFELPESERDCMRLPWVKRRGLRRKAAHAAAP